VFEALKRHPAEIGAMSARMMITLGFLALGAVRLAYGNGLLR